MGKLSGTRGSNPWRNKEDQQVGEGARTIALAKCGPIDPAGDFAALELAELTGTWGRS